MIFGFWPHIKKPRDQVALLAKYRKVFGSADGKDVLNDILLQAGFADVTPHDGPVTYNEGRRAVAKHIVNLLRLSDQEFSDLMFAAAKLQADFDQSNGEYQ